MLLDAAQRVRGVLVVAEEEELVLFDRATKSAAGLPVMRRRGGVREEIARLEPAVIVIAEKEGAAVQFIRSGLERH